MTETECDELFHQLDVDQDGRISFNDFKNAFIKHEMDDLKKNNKMKTHHWIKFKQVETSKKDQIKRRC